MKQLLARVEEEAAEQRQDRADDGEARSTRRGCGATAGSALPWPRLNQRRRPEAPHTVDGMNGPGPHRAATSASSAAGIVGIATARELQRAPPRRRRRRPRARGRARRPPERPLQRRHPCRDLLRAGIAEGAALRRRRRAVSTPTATERGIDARRDGKVIVATRESGAATARRARAARPRQRGARACAGSAPTSCATIEPHASGIAALHSPATGVVDFRSGHRARWPTTSSPPAGGS